MFPRLHNGISDFLSTLDMPVRFRLNLDPLGIVFFFLNTLRTLEAEHGITSKRQ